MAREYKIDVVVDDHGAVETLNKVATAEDNVATSGTKLGTTLDTVSAKQKIVVADTRGMDESFGRFRVSTVEADAALSDMHVSASKLPGTFAEMRGGLNDVAEGAGLTVAGLGMMATAGLVVGTAMASWGVTRAVAEFTGLDGAIDRTVGTVRTWVSGSQEAGAVQDVINKAIRGGASEMISYSEAIEFNTAKHREWMAAATEADNTVQRLKAPEESAHQLREWNLEIEKVRRDGVLGALTADIESHNFSQSTLAERYRISTGALGLFQRQIAETANEWKGYNAFVAEAIRKTNEHNKQIDDAAAKTEAWREKVQAIELGGDHAYSTLHQWLGELARDQKYLNELADTHMQKLIAEQGAAEKFLATELAAAQAQDALYQAGARAGGIGTPNDGSNERGPGINQGFTVPVNGGGINSNPTPIFKMPGVISSIRSFDVGGPTGPGGLSMLHQDEYVVPKDGALVKSGSSSAAAAASIIYLTVDAKGATFEDDRSLDRLTDKIATRLGVRYVQRGGG